MRSIFVLTGAFLGRIDSATRCAFWSDDPTDHDFDPQRLIEIDLARNPSAAAAGIVRWGSVEVDDCYSGPNGVLGGTTLGPRWPELGLMGAVSLELTFIESLPASLRPSCPPANLPGRTYEYTSAVYWPGTSDVRSGYRYVGHHAEILEEQGSLAYVAAYPPGRSAQPSVQAVKMWVDLSSPDQCDAGPDSLTTIKTGAAPKSGALFLRTGQVTSPSC